MNVARRLCGNADLPDELETLEDLADVIGLGRHGDRLEPSKATDAICCRFGEQGIKREELLRGHRRDQRLGGLLACPRAPRNRGSFDRRYRRQRNAGLAQASDHAGSDHDTLVGRPCRPCRGIDHERDVGPDRPAHPEPGCQFARMIGHRLLADRVVGEQGRRYAKLSCSERYQRHRHRAAVLKQLRERHTRMSK